jgi:hypothetical protein
MAIARWEPLRAMNRWEPLQQMEHGCIPILQLYPLRLMRVRALQACLNYVLVILGCTRLELH